MVRLVQQGTSIGLDTGNLFAGYAIDRLLGSGGMGEVYLAQHPRLPRREALKILSDHISADEEYRQRFIREADVAAALWHPNIVRVNDRGEFNGRLWISMDFVDGTDAASLLRDHYPVGMPAEQVATIVQAIASALDYAHQHQVMHRDVSPANILLTDPEDGDPRILLGDFGIARNIGDSSGLTATNMTIGTFPYAAPEQLTDEPIDGRADQYALAATAYHLLAGTTLFPHTNPAVVISRHLSAPPPALAETRPNLTAFDSVLAVALAKDPADRFARCTDFADAFARAARSGETSAASVTTMPRPVVSRRPQSSAAPPAPAHARRNRWRAFAAASMVIALAAVGASGYPTENETTAATASPSVALPAVAQPERAAEPGPTAPSARPQPAAEPAPSPAPMPPPSAPPPKVAPPASPPIPASVQAPPAPKGPPPAPQRPTPAPDQTFISLVEQIPGVTVTDPATAAATGRAVCSNLQSGGNPNDAAAATVNGNNGITPAQAAAGVNAAITAYCPQYQH